MRVAGLAIIVRVSPSGIRVVEVIGERIDLAEFIRASCGIIKSEATP
jgi:hypothetical protein